MSLQFVFGNSGSGKSEFLYRKILREAGEHPEKNYLLLVPEQFTMQTQRELVRLHPAHAIMNVDVLSFARLAYRVFDELGRQNLAILEETGKSLLLRKIAGGKKKELSVLGASLDKMGCIGEVKSLISELTQYDVSPDALDRFIGEGQIGEALALKLRDVSVLYRAFEEKIQGNYITAEEVLTALCDVAGESEIIGGSVMAFDGFTGFTPLQNKLMERLLTLCDKITVSLTMGADEDFYRARGGQELFAMSKKTVASLLDMAGRLRVSVEEPVVLSGGEKLRYRNAPSLFFMEQNLFRPYYKKWRKQKDELRIVCLKNPRDELSFAAKNIARYVREGGYRYKDFAVVAGDVGLYENYAEEIFAPYGIPYFIDRTRAILFHPFIEFIRAALEVVERDFSYAGVFRFLRCGFCGVTGEQTDLLENYVLEKGIRGKRRWGEQWTFATDGEDTDFAELNGVRERVYGYFEPLFEAFSGRRTVEKQTAALYELIEKLEIEQQLKQREIAYAEAGEAVRAKEYAQIYKIVMDLFDKVVDFLGGETVSVKEYADILDAGFASAKVGVIPPGNDHVTIGDIERTRLNHVKILFFVGVNDGVVPKAGNAGGILSQFEREKMAQNGMELAPGVRERVFIQRFYLYLNMTKPSDFLYVTFAKIDADGKALRRSYLIGTLLKLFPEKRVEEGDSFSAADCVVTPESGMAFYLEGLRGFSDGGDEKLWNALAHWYFQNEAYRGRAMRLLDAAYASYAGDPIGRAVTRALYGGTISGSVTRLERFAACAYAHFLTYGLMLRERRLPEFAGVDMGNLYHDALEHFARRVGASEYTWFNLPDDVREAFVAESMADAVAGCKCADVFGNVRNRYLLTRMEATAQRTAWALVMQIRKGRFVPEGFEVSFPEAEGLDAVCFRLDDGEKMNLVGRIDRIDAYEAGDKVYVKIIDYKSGNTSFSLLNLYHGLQLQLVVYLNAALELEGKRHLGKTAEPAGIFYYHIDNPIVEAKGDETEEEIRARLLEQLKPDGLVNGDPDVYGAMDTDFTGNSLVIPVAKKADGSLRATSKTIGARDFYTISNYVNQKIAEAGRRIFAGDISARPYRLEDRTGCDYCPYRTVCGFDARLPGYAYKKLEKFDDAAEVLEKMRSIPEEEDLE